MRRPGTRRSDRERHPQDPQQVLGAHLTSYRGNLMDKVMYVCGIVGLMAVGGMIATLVGATTPAIFSDGTVVIQDILDSIMPQMIPLALTGLMFWLIKKNVGTGWLLVIAIVGGVILSALGILA